MTSAFACLLGIACQELGLLWYFGCGSHGMANGAWDGDAALLRYCSLPLSTFGLKHYLAFVCSKRTYNHSNRLPELPVLRAECLAASRISSKFAPCDNARSNYEIVGVSNGTPPHYDPPQQVSKNRH